MRKQKKMNKRQITGIFGILTTSSFLIGFAVLYWFFNPKVFSATDGLLVVGLNVSGMNGLEWTQYFNYFFVGLLIISFSVSLLKNTNNEGLNKVGKILILLSGIIYTTLGFIEFDENSYITIWICLSQLVLTLALGSIGFILLSDDYMRIYKSKVVKYIIFSIGLLIILNGILQVFAKDIYPPFMGLFSWLIYFMGLGFIGITLILKPAHNI